MKLEKLNLLLKRTLILNNCPSFPSISFFTAFFFHRKLWLFKHKRHSDSYYSLLTIFTGAPCSVALITKLNFLAGGLVHIFRSSGMRTSQNCEKIWNANWAWLWWWRGRYRHWAFLNLVNLLKYSITSKLAKSQVGLPDWRHVYRIMLYPMKTF